MSYNDKLKEIISQPISKEENNNRNYQSLFSKNKYSYDNLPSTTSNKTELLSEIKSKIKALKQMKSNHPQEDLLNFDVSREGLKQYYSTGMIGKKESPTLKKSASKKDISVKKDNTNGFLDLNIKDIFKSNKNSKNEKNDVKEIDSSKEKKPKTKREYIKINALKYNTNNKYSSALVSEENVEDNKIKTQINLFVKQLNYNNTITTEKKKSRAKNHSISNYNITFNDKEDFSSYNLKQKKEINLNELKAIVSSFSSMTKEEMQNLSKEYISEMKKLGNTISSILIISNNN